MRQYNNMGNTKRTTPQNIDLIGRSFANLIVTDVKNIGGREMAICKCECGKEDILVRPSRLIRNTKHIYRCKHCIMTDRMRKMSEERKLPKGSRVSRLTIIGSRFINHKRTYECQCDCGKIVYATKNDLLNGKVKSCGCLSIERATKHHLCGSKIYRAWAAMKDRCTNVNNPRYNDYGGRGITLCQEWMQFAKFYRWSIVEGGYNALKRGLSIDRIDNNKGYSPKNCRWVTNSIQQNNKRNNLYVEYQGKKYTASELAKKVGISPDVMIKRLGELHWDVERALTTPVNHHSSPRTK